MNRRSRTASILAVIAAACTCLMGGICDSTITFTATYETNTPRTLDADAAKSEITDWDEDGCTDAAAGDLSLVEVEQIDLGSASGDLRDHRNAIKDVWIEELVYTVTENNLTFAVDAVELWVGPFDATDIADMEKIAETPPLAVGETGTFTLVPPQDPTIDAKLKELLQGDGRFTFTPKIDIVGEVCEDDSLGTISGKGRIAAGFEVSVSDAL